MLYEVITRIGLGANARARLFRQLDQQGPQQLDVAPREPKAKLRPIVGADSHQQPVVFGIVIDVDLPQSHAAIRNNFV